MVVEERQYNANVPLGFAMSNINMFTEYKWNLMIFQLFESVRG